MEESTFKSRLNYSGNKYDFIRLVLFTAVLVLLCCLKTLNYYIFHSTAEIFSCIIAGGIFMISLNTYSISKNDYFMFLGIGYLFILVLDLFHTYSYGDIIIFPNEVFDFDTKFWIAARFMELVTILASFVYLIKPNSKPNYCLVFLFYLAAEILIVLDIMYFKSLIPDMRIQGYGLTGFKIVAEYFMAAGFSGCCLILWKVRHSVDEKLFLLLEMSLVCKVISELFFTRYGSVTDVYNLLGHVFKVLSYYFLYKGVIENGLKRPFNMIRMNLDKADTIIMEKDKQKKSMEEVILQNEQCYDWIINNSDNGIALIVSHKIIFSNSRAVDMLGCGVFNDLSGMDIRRFISINTDIREKMFESKGNMNTAKIKIISCSDFKDAEASIKKIHYGGKTAYLLILKDLELEKEISSLKSNLKENEEELVKSNEYNKLVTEFFSNISHELKTPINVILSAIQLLMIKTGEKNENRYDNKSLDLFAVIKQNSFRLVRLVNNLLDITKSDCGFLKLELKNRNIVSIVEDITMSVGDYIKNKGIKLIFDTDTEERIIAVDEDKIERIMLNLLSNAVKFTNKGDLITVVVEDSEKYVKIYVRDTGVGIPADKLDLIFDRFGQVDRTLTRNREGSGIGLSLVKKLAEMHGGSVHVNSKLGVGSEFVVSIPVTTVKGNAEEECAIYAESKVDKVVIEFADVYTNDY